MVEGDDAARVEELAIELAEQVRSCCGHGAAEPAVND
jgi:hypothetical protein